MTTTPRRIVAFGHSHLGALAAAYATRAARTEPRYELVLYQFLRAERPHIVHVDKQGWRYHPEIEQELIELMATCDPEAVVILLQGEQAALAGFVAPVRPYDFIFPSETGYVPQTATEIIPYSVVFEVCKDRFRLIADFLDLLGDSLPRNSFALSPPPIVGDRKFILDTKGRHSEITHHIDQFGLPPTAWRLRQLKVHMMALRSIYEERGIRFVDPPAIASGDDGCLRPELRSDVFHANATYGQLLLDQIEDLLQQSPL